MKQHQITDFETLKTQESTFKKSRPFNSSFVQDMENNFNRAYPCLKFISEFFESPQNMAEFDGMLASEYKISDKDSKSSKFREPLFHDLPIIQPYPVTIGVYQDKQSREVLHIDGIAENRNPTKAFDVFTFLFFKNEYDAALHYYNKTFKFHPTRDIYPIPSTYGTATWLSFDDCLDRNLFGEQGIFLGIFHNVKARFIYTMRYTEDKHLITIAPSGTGKNRCVQIPNLLKCETSTIVIDPKGENATVTAKARRDVMNHDVFILNPFGILDTHFKEDGFFNAETNQFESDCFNPLDALDSNDKNFVSDVYTLCDALIEPSEKEQFWVNSAKELLSGLIMYVCSNEDFKDSDKRNLIYVREILTSDVDVFRNHINGIVQNNTTSLPIAQKLNRFRNITKEDKLNQSIIATAITETSFLDDPSIAKNLSTEKGINFKKFREKKSTLYVILPAKYLTIHAKWFKLVITSALNSFTLSPEGEKVLFMLDECSLLGRLNALETAIGYARGFGIQIWSFWQDIHQLYDTYGKRAESFLANAGVQQYFTPNDITTCDKISERLGHKTAYANSHTESASGSSKSQSETKVPFVNSSELLGMRRNDQIIFLSGSKNAMLANKYEYNATEIPSFCDNYSPNPYEH